MIIKVFGVPRSGGTLVTNLVREIFSECNQIIPEHNYFSDSDKAVAVFRDFRDCIASYWRAFCANFDEENFQKRPKLRWISGCVWEYKNLYIPRLNKFKTDWDQKNILFLRYEDFYNDFHFIFDSLENFLEIEIKKDKRHLMVKNFDFANVKKKTKYAENFWDGKLYKGFHGKHLYTGKPETYKEIFPDRLQQFINNIFNSELNDWNYESKNFKNIEVSLFMYKAFIIYYRTRHRLLYNKRIY